MGQPEILQLTPISQEVEQYARFELKLDINANYYNPYDYSQVEVYAVFKGPAGKEIQVDGFYAQEFALSTNGNLSPGSSGFKIRFAPPHVGRWQYRVFVRDENGLDQSEWNSFDCVALTSEENHGFARAHVSSYLHLDDGTPLVLIGENMCWPKGGPVQDYTNWLGKLKSAGGNYFRLWHAHWGLGIEWKNYWDDFKGLRRYHQANSRYQDWLFDYAAEQGMYVMLTLQHHGPMSTQVDPNWDDNPYNQANGGPCANAWDFFTNPSAIAHTKNRYRYIVARWGYARSILAWELFNEVDWMDEYETHQTEVMEWHAEMAEYLKQIDPYGHMVTTSFAHASNDPMVWALADIDITQHHHYLNTPHVERAVAHSIRDYRDQYDKPTMNGEFGLGLSSTLDEVDPEGIHLHNGMWAGLFGGGIGTGMTWWWDIYVDDVNLYEHFQALAQVVPLVPFHAQNMQPVDVQVLNAPGDLIITPTLDWGITGRDQIEVQPDGSLIPRNPGSGLSTFLYGTRWNAEHRNPPEFLVELAEPTTFKVRTGGEKGFSPRLRIQLNGQEILNQSAGLDKEYSVEIPAGSHSILVDNPGRDWVHIASYAFEGLGSQIDTYVLLGQEKTVAAGWLLNNEYNHVAMAEGALFSSLMDAQLQIEGLADTTYFVKWFDCMTGEITSVVPTDAPDGTMTLEIPPIKWDMAFLVDQADTTANDRPDTLQTFTLYPNPLQAGDILFVDLGPEAPINAISQLTLWDLTGRLLLTMDMEGPRGELPLPADLVPGMYWLRVAESGEIKTKAIRID